MASGHHNGFNPFRDAHGRWATPGGTGVTHAQEPSKGSGNMNDVIRSASGRATGGGGGGGDGGGSKPVNAKGANPSVITPKQLAAVDALPDALVSSVSAATQALLQERLGGSFPAAESLTYALSEISIQRQTGQLADVATSSLMAKALTEAGYVVPANVTKHDLLHLMDHVTQTSDYDLRDKRGLYGAAVAVKLGDLDVAHNFLDGPDGAGIGWTLTKDEIQTQLGIPITDGYAD
jgi:hypothetical protein